MTKILLLNFPLQPKVEQHPAVASLLDGMTFLHCQCYLDGIQEKVNLPTVVYFLLLQPKCK